MEACCVYLKADINKNICGQKEDGKDNSKAINKLEQHFEKIFLAAFCAYNSIQGWVSYIHERLHWEGQGWKLLSGLWFVLITFIVDVLLHAIIYILIVLVCISVVSKYKKLCKYKNIFLLCGHCNTRMCKIRKIRT